MGWRFRKSIGGKYFRVNLGKHGVTSTTFGKRGMPHVTVGESGTRVGASIPGTGLYYSQRIDNATTTQLPIITPPQQTPVQTAVLPPNVPPTRPSTPPDGHKFPWSKLVIASFTLGLIGLVFSFTPAAAVGALSGLIAFFLGLAGLIVIAIRKRRRSLLAASLSILLALITFIVGAANTPETTPTASPSVSTSSDTASQSAKTAASATASASRAAEAKKQADVAAVKLADAKTKLTDKINDAHTLLESSNNNVADPQTRVALTDAINTASAINSADPQAYTDAVTPLEQTMDAVNASIEQKKQDDATAVAAQKAAEQQAAAKKAADAAAAKKAAEQKAAADATAAEKAKQQQQTPNSMGTAHGGAFCSPAGAQAQSDRSSSILTCRVATDGRLRWKL
ncbi:DUF4236 domain-containing protein [Bifidobacterium aquikefiri]|uniref:DUF4236 domain-containing protein n=2 Tax=Bifidobacterium aquikefiri TaxID=1653207 RepID=UPI0023EF670F|nr:DUF4236 domain-containing protein [Bifidobacterium aquikefiri]